MGGTCTLGARGLACQPAQPTAPSPSAHPPSGGSIDIGAGSQARKDAGWLFFIHFRSLTGAGTIIGQIPVDLSCLRVRVTTENRRDNKHPSAMPKSSSPKANTPWLDGVQGTQVLPLITLDEKAIRVEAGPGTGKTFGLARRVARIMHKDGLNVPGKQVLVVAFNRVIAKQLGGISSCSKPRAMRPAGEQHSANYARTDWSKGTVKFLMSPTAVTKSRMRSNGSASPALRHRARDSFGWNRRVPVATTVSVPVVPAFALAVHFASVDLQSSTARVESLNC